MKNCQFNSQFTLIIATLLSFLANSTQAQIVPDRSLPNDSEIIQEGNRSTIEGGTTRGNNLFHSFEQFSIPTNVEAFFNNDSFIQNIFGRVTGDLPSNIDGLIRANGSANLFFLNPNGIVFGANARLDIGGSFIGTTANSILFADGFEFNANTSSTTALLTNEVPVGLGFAENPGSIQVQGYGHNLQKFPDFRPFTVRPFTGRDPSISFQVKPGHTLALLGNNIALSGGVLTAEGGKIELGSVSNGFVRLNFSGSSWSFNYEAVSSFGDIHLGGEALLDASGAGRASIQIYGANVTLSDGSIVLIQNQGTQPSELLKVQASESLEVSGFSFDRLNRSGFFSESIGAGQGANVLVSSPQILVSEGAISTGTYGSANGGNLAISAEQLALLNGGAVGVGTVSAGKGGNLSINVSDKLQVIGFSPLLPGILSAIASSNWAEGNGGNINISAQELIVKDGAFIGSNVIKGSGQGGDTTINVSDSVDLIGKSFLGAQSALTSTTFSSGNAGTLTLNTSNLRIRDGATITSSAFVNGNAGNLLINANLIEISKGGLISSSAEKPPEFLQDTLNFPSQLSAFSGSIFISTQHLRVVDGGQISVRNDGSGNAGNLQISSPFIFLDNSANISAATESGQGGNILINSSDLRLNNNSSITATAGGTGNGGNININSDTITALQNSDITANAFAGRGGNIDITTQGLFLLPDSDITASSQLGVDGTVNVEVLQTVQQEPAAPKTTITTEDLLATSCFNRTQTRGTFQVVGQSSLPMKPDSGVDSSGEAVKIPKPTEEDVSERHPQVVANSQRPWKIGDPIVEPNAVETREDGKTYFVHVSSSGTPLSFEDLICKPKN